MQSRPLRVPQPGGADNADRTDGHQRMNNDIDRADDTTDQKLKQHSCPTLDWPTDFDRLGRPSNRLHPFGVKTPVAAFMADSSMLFVSDRIWSWKKSD